jgi:hypothetical protein
MVIWDTGRALSPERQSVRHHVTPSTVVELNKVVELNVARCQLNCFVTPPPRPSLSAGSIREPIFDGHQGGRAEPRLDFLWPNFKGEVTHKKWEWLPLLADFHFERELAPSLLRLSHGSGGWGRRRR